MPVSFAKIVKGHAYLRNSLADLWGYSSYHAIARGVVTPQHDNKIIRFVTEEKQDSLEQYADRLVGDTLHWGGPNDHFAEDCLLHAATSGEEIHLFYRVRHHMDFTYLGRETVTSHNLHMTGPSQLTLKLTGQ
jgi:hypothetical protein